MSPVPTFKLNTGATIPAIGFGTWSGRTPEEWATCKPWIASALKAGYTHLDTAFDYGTEKYIGETIKELGIPRESLFITTKLSWNHHSKVQESIEQSLADLGVDYVDLWLMHWPQSVLFKGDHVLPTDEEGQLITVESPTFNETWAEMEKVYASGKAKAIGVSNFSIKNLEKLLTTAKVIPAVNQVEMHPYLQQPELKAYCDEKGILVTAYSPTGWAPVREDPLINELAAKYNATTSQVVLAWHLARGVVVVPKSTNPERQKQHLELPALSTEDVKRISTLDKNLRLCNAANEKGKVWGWTYEQLGW